MAHLPAWERPRSASRLRSRQGAGTSATACAPYPSGSRACARSPGCGRQVLPLAGVVLQVIELDRRVPPIQVAADRLPVALNHRLLAAVAVEFPEHELVLPLLCGLAQQGRCRLTPSRPVGIRPRRRSAPRASARGQESNRDGRSRSRSDLAGPAGDERHPQASLVDRALEPAEHRPRRRSRCPSRRPCHGSGRCRR